MGRAPTYECLEVGLWGDPGKNGKRHWRRVVFYRNEDTLFYAQVSFDFPGKIGLSHDDLHNQLQGKPIPLHHVYPSFIAKNFTVAPDPVPRNTHVKLPNFLRYRRREREAEDTIAQLVRNEALVCEVLKRNPHPNVARFVGCQVRNGRITGLCFEKYKFELGAMIKSCPSSIDKDRCLEGVRRGMEHLHSLGYVHNDIKPRNVMIDNGGNAVLIDFDSCRPIGAALGPKFGSKGFCRYGAKTCEKKNDYYSLLKLRKYMDEKV